MSPHLLLSVLQVRILENIGSKETIQEVRKIICNPFYTFPGSSWGLHGAPCWPTVSLCINYDVKTPLQLFWGLLSLQCPLEQASCCWMGREPESTWLETRCCVSKPRMELMEWGKSCRGGADQNQNRALVNTRRFKLDHLNLQHPSQLGMLTITVIYSFSKWGLRKLKKD